MNIYIDLTKKFNEKKLRAVICSGQAVVLHRLAIMSKDGDWIVREDEETLNHIISVLSEYGAKYRFGAPLDIKWLKYGWSSHFEFTYEKLRVRTDFFSRPQRLTNSDIERLWFEHKDSSIPFVNVVNLTKMKMTNREKDYVVIGELARMMRNPENQLLYSRSARDLLELSEKLPNLIKKLIHKRSLLGRITEGRDKVEELLDAEKRILIHKNEERLKKFIKASENWSIEWLSVKKKIANLSLIDAHKIVVNSALEFLPFEIND